jgi:hypothetical protein
MTSPGTSSPGSARIRLVGGPTTLAPAFDRHGATGQLLVLVPGGSTTIGTYGLVHK